jgi:hypothetical protein
MANLEGSASVSVRSYCSCLLPMITLTEEDIKLATNQQWQLLTVLLGQKFVSSILYDYELCFCWR